MGKNDKKGKGGGGGGDKDAGGGKAKGAQAINVRHILVSSSRRAFDRADLIESPV